MNTIYIYILYTVISLYIKTSTKINKTKTLPYRLFRKSTRQGVLIQIESYYSALDLIYRALSKTIDFY